MRRPPTEGLVRCVLLERLSNQRERAEVGRHHPHLNLATEPAAGPNASRPVRLGTIGTVACPDIPRRMSESPDRYLGGRAVQRPLSAECKVESLIASFEAEH